MQTQQTVFKNEELEKAFSWKSECEHCNRGWVVNHDWVELDKLGYVIKCSNKES